MNYEIHVKEFSELAKEYCDWVETKNNKGEDQLYYLQTILSDPVNNSVYLPL